MAIKRTWKLRGHAFLLQLFFCFVYSPCVAEKENATAPLKPLWTPEDCVTLPEETVKDISSDGKYTLIRVDHTSLENDKAKEYSTCVLVNNETLKEERIIGEFNYSCIQPQFIGKGQFFSYITIDTHGGERTSTLFVQEISSKKQTKVQELSNDLQNYIFAPDGKSFAFLTYLYVKQSDSTKTVLGFQKVNKDFQPIGSALYKSEFDLYSPFDSSFYRWSPDSQKVAFVATTLFWRSDPKATVYILDIGKDKLTEIDDVIGDMGDLAFSPDSQKLAFIKGDGYGKQKTPLKPFKELEPDTIQVVDLKTENVMSIDAVDIEHIAGWTENNKALIVTKQVGTKLQLYSLDIETKKLTLMEVPDVTYITNAILSSNSKYIGFSGENLHQPSASYVSNLDSFFPKKVSTVNEKINLTALKATPITWKSYDGLEIEGILTYPQDYKPGQKVPLLVSIQGGPGGVESQQFIGKKLFEPFSPAVFASQGVATLVVNYRGCRGYGQKFQDSDYKDLGGGDYKDIMTGIDYLVDQGIADPDQLFIRGPSYGGFLTAWAIGHTNRFKAAIVEAGTVDWISDSATTDAPVPMSILFGGAYWENYELWRETSPIRYVSRIETPTLIIQGKKDKRVSTTQSLQLYSALKARNIPTRLVYYDGQGHSFSSPVALRDGMNETLTWMKTYGGKKEAIKEKQVR
ncbi:MAG: S9 family peptidase [Alphaproteobacteria bacterium]|nr:S9 family peptidase [Alphaproteobacteria bacterium]